MELDAFLPSGLRTWQSRASQIWSCFFTTMGKGWCEKCPEKLMEQDSGYICTWAFWRVTLHFGWTAPYLMVFHLSVAFRVVYLHMYKYLFPWGTRKLSQVGIHCDPVALVRKKFHQVGEQRLCIQDITCLLKYCTATKNACNFLSYFPPFKLTNGMLFPPFLPIYIANFFFLRQ